MDPLEPGKPFRPDAIIAQPNLFGQTIVAERLGVPLHCMSDTPQSRTQVFPHLMSANVKLDRPYRYAPVNATSYDAFDKLGWESLGDILDEFRYSLGLTGKSTTNNLLAEWRVPHTYLWILRCCQSRRTGGMKSRLQGALIWRKTKPTTLVATIKSCKRLLKGTRMHQPSTLVCSTTTGVRVTFKELVVAVKKAAETANVRIIFQRHGNNNVGFSSSGVENKTVFEVNQHFPVKRILPYVHAAIHWGDLSITSACLAAAKPASLWGLSLALSGAGVQPLGIDSLTPFNLVQTIKLLLDPKLTDCAKSLAPTFSSSNAIETAVSAFYTNLPLTGMTCDLDPSRAARVYDSVHELKLSYEARLVVHQITRDGGSASDLKYKPLKYSQRHPPKFSLRQLDTERLRSSSSDMKDQPRVVYTHDPDSEDLVKGGSPSKRRSSLLRGQSMTLNVVEMPRFWSSPEEQTKRTEEINSTHEKVLAEHGSRESSLTSSNSSPSKTSMASC